MEQLAHFCGPHSTSILGSMQASGRTGAPGPPLCYPRALPHRPSPWHPGWGRTEFWRVCFFAAPELPFGDHPGHMRISFPQKLRSAFPGSETAGVSIARETMPSSSTVSPRRGKRMHSTFSPKAPPMGRERVRAFSKAPWSQRSSEARSLGFLTAQATACRLRRTRDRRANRHFWSQQRSPSSRLCCLNRKCSASDSLRNSPGGHSMARWNPILDPTKYTASLSREPTHRFFVF